MQRIAIVQTHPVLLDRGRYAPPLVFDLRIHRAPRPLVEFD